MAKVSNEIKELYKKVRRNLLSQVRRLEKMGFKGAREKVPKIPKTIKPESISNLERLTKDKYRKLKEGLTTEKGETVREVEYERRKESTRKGKRTKERRKQEREEYGIDDFMTSSDYAENVILNYEEELVGFNDAFSSYMQSYLDELLKRYGDWDVAMMINRMADANVLPSRWQMYTEEGALNYTSQMFSYMPSLRSEEDIMAMEAYSRSVMNNYTESFDQLRLDYNNERRRAREAQRR